MAPAGSAHGSAGATANWTTACCASIWTRCRCVRLPAVRRRWRRCMGWPAFVPTTPVTHCAGPATMAARRCSTSIIPARRSSASTPWPASCNWPRCCPGSRCNRTCRRPWRTGSAPAIRMVGSISSRCTGRAGRDCSSSRLPSMSWASIRWTTRRACEDCAAYCAAMAGRFRWSCPRRPARSPLRICSGVRWFCRTWPARWPSGARTANGTWARTAWPSSAPVTPAVRAVRRCFLPAVVRRGWTCTPPSTMPRLPPRNCSGRSR